MPKLEKVACLLRPSHGLSSLHSAGQRPASQQCSWARVHNGPGGPGTCCGPCLSPREGVVLFWGAGRWPNSSAGHPQETPGALLVLHLGLSGWIGQALGASLDLAQPPEMAPPAPQAPFLVSIPLGLGGVMGSLWGRKLDQGARVTPGFWGTSCQVPEAPSGQTLNRQPPQPPHGQGHWWLLEATECSVTPNIRETLAGRGGEPYRNWVAREHPRWPPAQSDQSLRPGGNTW